MTDYSRYEALRDAGAQPIDVCRTAMSDQLDWMATVRMVRAVFGLGLAEAKDVIAKAQGARSLDEEQGKLVDAVREALDRDEIGSSGQRRR